MPEFSALVDLIDKQGWEELINVFKDLTIFQTWSYGAIRWGEEQLSHLILKKDNVIIAAAQLRIIKLPFLNKGIAYLPWGPLWHTDNGNNEENLKQMLIALKQEYVVKRKLYLRILPHDIKVENSKLEDIYKSVGFRWSKSPYNTIILDLRSTLDEIKNNFTRSWRKALNSSLKKNISYIQGSSQEIFDQFHDLYNDMLYRKKFVPGVSVQDFMSLQQQLPEHLKMQCIIFKHEGMPVSGIIGSCLGFRGMGLLAAAGSEGLKLRLNASNLLHWTWLQLLKGKGADFYDLNGIDEKKNPKGYFFKKGMGGQEVTHIGRFDLYNSFSSLLVVKCSDWLRELLKAFNYVKVHSTFLFKKNSSNE